MPNEKGDAIGKYDELIESLRKIDEYWTNKYAAAITALQAEVDAAKLKSENIVQMLSDRISQMSHDDEGLSPDDVQKEIAAVAAATGNKCDDDSLWFAGKEWQALKKYDNYFTAAARALVDAVDVGMNDARINNRWRHDSCCQSYLGNKCDCCLDNLKQAAAALKAAIGGK
jgi:hypothetical protein